MTSKDNQRPVDELDEILVEWVKAHGVKEVHALDKAKAHLLQWGTRQRIEELDQLLENMYDDGYPDGCQVVHEHDIADRLADLQSSLKDGGNDE